MEACITKSQLDKLQPNVRVTYLGKGKYRKLRAIVVERPFKGASRAFWRVKIRLEESYRPTGKTFRAGDEIVVTTGEIFI